MRERENYSQKNGPTGKEKPRDRDPWSYRDRPTILQGLDINALVDRLSDFTHNRHLLFVELDKTREANRDIFDSGKACTALISVSARRKNIVLGQAIWDWMDVKGLQKNTFHYNSMISVTEKARDHRRALALLKEMSEKRIPKNEVTYVEQLIQCALIDIFGNQSYSFAVFSLVCNFSAFHLQSRHVRNAVNGKLPLICSILWKAKG